MKIGWGWLGIVWCVDGVKVFKLIIVLESEFVYFVELVFVDGMWVELLCLLVCCLFG